MDPIVAKVVGFRRINLGVLEELAIAHKVPRLLVRYNRCEKRRNLEAVCQSVQAAGCIRFSARRGRTIVAFRPSNLDCLILIAPRPCVWPARWSGSCPDDGQLWYTPLQQPTMCFRVTSLRQGIVLFAECSPARRGWSFNCCFRSSSASRTIRYAGCFSWIAAHSRLSVMSSGLDIQ